MFDLIDYQDNYGRKYKLAVLSGKETDFSPVPVTFIMLTYNCEDYIEFVLNSIKKQTKRIFVIDNGSTDKTVKILQDHGVNYTINRTKGDLSHLANVLLTQIPKGWTFIIDSDEVLFDLEDEFVGRYAHFLQEKKIWCSDFRFLDFMYNYGTLNAAYDWGEGPGRYWVARKLFYYTGKEKFVNKFHFNISNTTRKDAEANYEHTGEWEGTVAKTNTILLFHYGKLRGIERWRDRDNFPGLEPTLFMRGRVATIPYDGLHPSVMGL